MKLDWTLINMQIGNKNNWIFRATPNDQLNGISWCFANRNSLSICCSSTHNRQQVEQPLSQKKSPETRLIWYKSHFGEIKSKFTLIIHEECLTDVSYSWIQGYVWWQINCRLSTIKMQMHSFELAHLEQ